MDKTPFHPNDVIPQKFSPAPHSNNDAVDDFVDKRHQVMLQKVVDASESDQDMGDEPEISQRQVFNLQVSDSDSDSSSDTEDELGADAEDPRIGFGGKRRDWYGGDTHEYEIMDDEEREKALKDEEEEAVRMQINALSKMTPDDFQDDGMFDEQGEEETLEEHEKLINLQNPTSEVTASVFDAAAPEVSVLVKEMIHCHKEADIWETRIHWNETARCIYHLNASFVCNVAFYLSLRTDPDSEGVDIRTHPVLVRIVGIRNLLKTALELPCEAPKDCEGSKKLAVKETALKKRTEKGAQLVGHVDTHPALDGSTSDKCGDEMSKKKRKRKRRKKDSAAKEVKPISPEEDERRIETLLKTVDVGNNDSAGLEKRKADQKRRKLNQVIGAMERERKNESNKRVAPVDLDVVRPEPTEMSLPSSTYAQGYDASNGMEDDDEVMEKMLAKKAKKEARLARKAAQAVPHVYRFKDDTDPTAKRKANTQIVKNRGLTRYRPRDKKTPRTKNRLAYSKAVIRRKGAVQEYGGKSDNYSGEASGINMSARKGSRLSNV